MESTAQQGPYIVATKSDETMQYHIYIESDCLLSAHILADALADLICIYFISDIVYPKSI